ncbi:PLP-dependent aminotransferase family protein [Paracoccus sp. JM45]|uniref:aminotransferase-like domain-containing protein n=1 Tax=Paracoccus sp. JM45 TaxID=2283626 RepID=UPI000E6D13EC|nr:PLP-dependent aminotransferase family protein [Paracoccus sp. JM45]RJE79115.1 PLP-dependent aminotransferase family protein [Paracoccus sp. JM45]
MIINNKIFKNIDLRSGDGPVYQQLCDAIILLIESKELAEGDRLPPHRDLAQFMGVNVSTVTRAIKLLQQRGHVESRVGSGSYICPLRPGSQRSGVLEAEGVCDLSINRPATDAYLHALERLLPNLPFHSHFSMIQDYHIPQGDDRVRRAFAGWLSPTLGHADPDRLVVVNGCQHGMSCIVDTIAQSGDVILTDQVTFHGFISLCASKAIRLKSVETDQAGMVPDAFREACIQHRPKAVFLMPNNHNPTTVTLSARRRQALGDIAKEQGVYIIEDDVCGPLMDHPLPTIASSHPDITFYVTSLSKCIAAGTRLGVVSAPPSMVTNLANTLRLNCWSTNSLMNFIAATMIEQGELDRIVATEKAELRARNLILRETLPVWQAPREMTSPFAWFEMPEPWRCATFVKSAQQAGICVLTGEAFSFSQNPLHAVRININAARSRDELRKALATLQHLASTGHRHALMGL